MMYRIQEKFWSFGDQFSITDQDENEMFRIKGKAFSWGDKLSFQDIQGTEHACIQQKLFAWQPRYQIMRSGLMFAEVVKEWTWLNKRFTLDIPGPNDYEITGSFWEHEFLFIRSGREVAHVSKKRWKWTDTYGVRIREGEEDVLILCTCIVIDQVLHDERGRHAV